MVEHIGYRFRVDRFNLPMKRVRDLLRVWRIVGKQYRQKIAELEKSIARSRVIEYERPERSWKSIDESDYDRLKLELAALRDEIRMIISFVVVPIEINWVTEDPSKLGGLKLTGEVKVWADDLLRRCS